MNGYLNGIEETISRLAETTRGGKIICAVSGGPDSVAMFLMLHKVLPDTFELAIAHFDHNIREDSGKDARWVKELAGDIPFYTGGDNVPERAGILRMNLEEAARNSRRDFLRRLTRDIGAVRVTLGHTLDDQATTVLMNLARGAGSDGLSGMEEDDGLFLRPLLKYRKSELISFLEDRAQPYLSDSSNEDFALTRNRIEQVVLPELQSANSGAVANIVNASNAIREQNEYLNELVDEISGGVIEERNDTVLIPDLYLLRGYIFKALLKKAFLRLAPTKTLEASHYAEVERLGDGGSANLPGRIIASRNGDSLWLNPAQMPSLDAWSAEVTVPGKLLIPDISMEVIIAEEPAPAEFPGQKADIAWFRKEVIGDSVTVRSRRSGDYFRPSGGIGKSRIKDYFIDEKIPKKSRSSVPLVEANGEIIWVVGYRIADGVGAVPGEESISICIV